MSPIVVPPTLPLPEGPVSDALEQGLVSVEARLADAVSAANPLVSKAARHLVEAGGKRFRPMLTLLAAQFGDGADPRVIEAACVVELTHLATLYHDDVMDEAQLRRGAASANSRFDNSVAILTGDYLFARASDIVADLGPDAVRLQARTFSRLVSGQIAETAGPGPGEDVVAHHLQVLAEKTGSLIATSARFGAQFAGCDAAVVDTLTEFGEVMGVMFQLSDDLIDITANSSGKAPGTDLREGVATLPVLLLQADADPAAARLRELVSAPLTDDALHAEALSLLRNSEALAQARVTVDSYAERARALLATLPSSDARDALESLTGYVIDRDR